MTAVPSATATAPTTTNNNNNPNAATLLKRDLNPRWTSYVTLVVASSIGMSAVDGVNITQFVDQCAKNNKNLSARTQRACWVFALVSLLVSLILVLADFYNSKYRLGSTPGNVLDLKNSKNYSEGVILLIFCVWWAGGLIAATQPGGIAYVALNIYYSFWVCFFVSVYTLNAWAKDRNKEDSRNISFRNLTHLSWTLRGWYFHAFFAFVVFVSSAQLQKLEADNVYYKVVATICISFFSFLISTVVILTHYKLACCFCGYELPLGGFAELTIAFALTIAWICEVSYATTFGGFAATITGSSVVLNNGQEQTMPGSNLYFASWFSFISICFVIRQWNAERIMEFTKTQQTAVDDIQVGVNNVPLESLQGNVVDFSNDEDDNDI